MAVIYVQEEHNEKALETCHIALDHLQALPYINDKTVKTRILYNIARIQSRLGQFAESSKSCDKGIKWCLEQDQLYLLAELHYHLGYNLELQKDIPRAMDYLNKSMFLFELQGNRRFSSMIKDKIDQWKAKEPETM